MSHTTILKSFELPSNQALNVGDCNGLWLHATRGVAWITIAGLGEDIFLSAGQSCQMLHSGVVVVEALDGPAVVELGRQGAPSKVGTRHHLRPSREQRETLVNTPAQARLG